MVADGGEAMWWGTITFWLSVLFCKLGAMAGYPGESAPKLHFAAGT